MDEVGDGASMDADGVGVDTGATGGGGGGGGGGGFSLDLGGLNIDKLAQGIGKLFSGGGGRQTAAVAPHAQAGIADHIGEQQQNSGGSQLVPVLGGLGLLYLLFGRR